MARQSQWRWVAAPELDGYAAAVVWAVGHRRWGVENRAFNELTQHYHLTHCPRHEPVAILAWLLILAPGFNLETAVESRSPSEVVAGVENPTAPQFTFRVASRLFVTCCKQSDTSNFEGPTAVSRFNLFELFVLLHGKLWRQGRETLAEAARQPDRALESVGELQPLWSG